MGLALWLQSLAVSKLPLSTGVKDYLLSPAGPFTVFFWAPVTKWFIVIANIKDMAIPAENISTPQQFVLFMSGCIWSRYALQIYPFSWNLLSVQIFMAGSAAYQLARKAVHSYTSKS